MLIKSVLPKAVSGDLRAVKAFTDLAKLEIEWRREVSPVSHNEAQDADDDTIILEAFEQTLSSSSSLYDIALGHINEDWLARDSIPLDSIYSNDSSDNADPKAMHFAGIEPLDTRIAKIEETVAKLDVRQEGDDDDYDPD